MKKVICFLLIVMLVFLPSCKTVSDTDSGFDNNTETGKVFTGDINDKKFTRFRQSDYCSHCQFVQTYKGCYYCKNGFIYFSSDGISKYMKLCSKPDCLHNDRDENCNAYANTHLIAYYDRYIYYISVYQNSYWLCRMNMDGTDHTNIKPIATAKEGCTAFFEHGYLYYYKGFLGLLGNVNTAIYKTAVFDNSESVVVLDVKDKGIVVDDFAWFYPQDGYIYIYSYSPETEYSLCRYSMETGKWSDFVNTEMCCQSVFTEENKVYWYLFDDGFYEYTYETGITKRVADAVAEGFYAISYNDEYIYAFQYSEKRDSGVAPMFYIYDRQYKLIDSVLIDIEMEDYILSVYLTELEDYVLLTSSLINKPPDYYLLKSEFGSGDIKVRKIGE